MISVHWVWVLTRMELFPSNPSVRSESHRPSCRTWGRRMTRKCRAKCGAPNGPETISVILMFAHTSYSNEGWGKGGCSMWGWCCLIWCIIQYLPRDYDDDGRIPRLSVYRHFWTKRRVMIWLKLFIEWINGRSRVKACVHKQTTVV